MSLAGAMALHEAFGWEPKIDSWRWRLAALAPQIGFLAVWYQRPLWLVIAIGAFLSLTDNIVAWSFYLLLNDKRVLGENRCRSYLWNLGLLLQITLLNSIAIILDALPGIGTNLLAARLKGLSEEGLVTQRRVPPPTPASVYELTEAGRALEPVLLELVRWGLRYRKPAGKRAFYRPTWVVLAYLFNRLGWWFS